LTALKWLSLCCCLLVLSCIDQIGIILYSILSRWVVAAFIAGSWEQTEVCRFMCNDTMYTVLSRYWNVTVAILQKFPYLQMMVFWVFTLCSRVWCDISKASHSTKISEESHYATWFKNPRPQFEQHPLWKPEKFNTRFHILCVIWEVFRI